MLALQKKAIYFIAFYIVEILIAILIIPYKAFAFEAYQVKIKAILHPQEDYIPPQPQCEVVVIEGTKSVSSLTFKNKTVILKSGSVLIPKLSNINLNIGCDFIIEPNALIDVNGAQDGSIRLIVGHNLIVDGKILAFSDGTASSIRISTGNDALINGEVNASGTNSAGIIRIDAKGKLVINSHSIKANSLSGAGGEIRLNVVGDLEINGKLEAKSQENFGGSVRLAVDGKIYINGIINTSGVQKGGSIRMSSEKGIDIKQNANIDFSSLTRNGGTFLLDTANDLNIKGEINGNGLNQGGSFIATISRDGFVSGKITVNATNIDSGDGGTIALNASQGKLVISGILEAKGKSNNGSVNLTYCSKDFTGAQFNPLPFETDNCPNSQTLNVQNVDSLISPANGTSLSQNVNLNTDRIIQIGNSLINYFNSYFNDPIKIKK